MIESKGGILPSVSLAFSECSSLYNFDEVTHVTKYLFLLTSGCWQECNPHQWLYNWSLLSGQHL